MAGAALSVSEQEITNCSIVDWYNKFKNITFKSIFIPLSTDFVKYLKADGIILPHGCVLPSHVGCKTQDKDSSDSSDSESDEKEIEEPYFPAVVEKIEAAIVTLGGKVVPKLNWSTPRDASWLLPGNTIQCTTVAEVILLLKSSNFVAHDLTRIFDYCSDVELSTTITYTLCLRKWEEFHPSAEFRCFVHNTTLIAISQRECTTHYSHLVGNRDNVLQEITAFFKANIRNKFPDHNYVFDICRISEGDIRLVDFNPCCLKTDPLLFSWEELGDINERDAPVIKVIMDESSIRPNDLQEYRLPQDFIDLSTGEDIHKFVDFLKMKQVMAENSESD